MPVEEISDRAWFVLPAYLAAFLPWTFLASKDFIGPRWKTVRDTRRAGMYHAILSVIPACYIITYMIVQGLSNDYKEMSAALVAFMFTLLNLLRTMWGLWQLRCFRSWAISSIQALEAMGVRYDTHKTISSERQKDSENSESNENLDNSDHKKRSQNASTIADRLLVNDTIVDNQVAHGEARCFLKYGDIELKSVADNEVSVVRYLRNIWQGLRIVACLLFDYGRSVFGKKRCASFEMVPIKAVDVWLNWSVAFAAQGLGQWIEDFSVSRDPRDDARYDDLSAKERWEKRAQFFGSQLVNSAWLQLWPETGLGQSRLTTSPFHWSGVWDEESRMNDGFIMKDELLGKAMKSGKALPFGASHDNVNKDGGRSGYDAYQRKFDQIVRDVPVQMEFDKMIEEFDIEKLEWLTILLYIGKMAREKGRQLCEEVRDRACPSESLEPGTDNNEDGISVSQAFTNLSEEVSDRASWSESLEPGADNNEEEKRISQALSNLKTQVYLSQSSFSNEQESELQRTVEMFNCVSVGIPQHSKVFLSEANRHVSKVGEMIDTWMSLVCGDQIAFLMRLNGNSFWEDVCFCGNVSILNEESSGSLSCDDSKAVQAIHAEVEKRRIFYNFVNDGQFNWIDSCDQFLTFMGYGMETVRSRLGRWVVRNESEHGSEEEFCPLLEGLEDVSIELGQEVTQVLLEDSKMCNLSLRGIQTRVLWEVQQELTKPDDVGPGSANLILLCILSFPSICIELEKGDMENMMSETERGSVLVNVCGLPRMRMYAKGGPQEIDVIGTFSENGEALNVKLHLRLSEEVKRFKWVLWRDAFLGRLKGLKEWQEEHGIQSAELHLTDGEMKVELEMMKTSAGEKVVCWPGWKPFRFEMMRFELESEGLLKEQFEEERKDADHVLQFANALETQDRKDLEGELLAWQGKLSLYLCLGSIPRMQVKAVAYTEASGAVLRQAFLVVEKAFDVDGTGGLAKVEIDRSKVLLGDAKKCLVNDWERAVSLLEIGAMVDGNEEALGECVDVLMKQGNKREAGWRVVFLLEGFLAQMYSDGKRYSVERRSCQETLFSKCLEVIERFGGQYRITGRLSRLLAHIWTINRSCFREKTLVALQNLHGMRKDVTVMETLSLLLYDDFSSGKVDRKLEGNIDMLMKRRERMEAMCTGVSDEHIRDNAKVCEWFNRNAVEKLRGMDGDSESESRWRRACVRISTLKGLDRGSSWEDYEESVAMYRKAAEAGNIYDTMLAITSWATLLIEGQGCYTQNEVEVGKVCDFAIEHGNRPTSFLANALSERKDNAICTRKAVELYRHAIDGGNVSAKYNLAVLLEDGAEGMERNAKEAVMLYRSAIDGGEVCAMYNLALLLKSGAEGVERNAKEAVELYRRAIDGGHVSAMYNLALLLENGAEGVERNAKEAVELYRGAIGGYHVGAMYNLALLLENGTEGVERNAKEAVELYRGAIGGYHVGAMYNLALLLENGTEGVERNAKEAVELYHRAMHGGDVGAMYNLALLLKNGAEGVEPNVQEAVELYRRAIDGGHVGAMYNLAVLLQDGAEGVERNAKEAVKLYCRAIDGGDVDAMNSLARLLKMGAKGVERDAQEAVELYRRAIDDGDVNAIYNLALLLQIGAQGVECNAKEAVELYRGAIDGGHVGAMYNLACLLEDGAEGVERNAKEAAELYCHAIDGGDVDAMNNLACLLEDGAEGVERNVQEAVELYRRAIDGGHVGAISNLALLLKNGAEGLEPNAKEAVDLYRRAIDGGDDGAMYNLAVLLHNGAEGLEPNRKEAVELYRRAIDGGHVFAMYNLAFLLQDGAEGVERNAKEAVELYRRAIDGGDVDAMNNLAFLLKNGAEGVERDAQEAVELYRRAIDDGDVDAISNLALLLKNGAEGVEPNAKEAAELYRRAIDAGHVGAMYNLACLLEDGAEGVERNAKEAVELYRRAINRGHVNAMKKLLTLPNMDAVELNVN